MDSKQSQFIVDVANRFQVAIESKESELKLTAEKKATKTKIDLEYDDFIDHLEADKQKLATSRTTAEKTANEAFRDGINVLKAKLRLAEEQREKEYIKAGISKEYIPVAKMTLETLDKFATDFLNGISTIAKGMFDYLGRKFRGERG